MQNFLPNCLSHISTRNLGGLIGLLVLIASTTSATVAWGRIEAEAVPGRPFGVGRISLQAGDVGGQIDLERALISEKSGRILYPVASTQAFGKVLGQILGTPLEAPPNSITWYFLFLGDAPLTVTVQTPTRVSMVVEVRAEPARAENKLFGDWWKAYREQANHQIDSGDYSPLVQVYLQSMLGSRLGLEAPASNQPPASQAKKSIELLFAGERLRMEVLRETAAGRADFGQPANLAVPPAPLWPPLALPPFQADVAVEPLAMRVPEECFYVRFGNFANYLWLDKLLEDYGGDISSMVTLRGYLAPMNERVQKQLVLKKNNLSALLGGQVIADIAMLGQDTFVNEGGAVGILFQTKNGLLLSSLGFQRSQMQAQEKANGATLDTVTIAGKEVSFLSTPDNRVRSFMVNDGNFILVTNCRRMAERFLETGKGQQALGASADFKFARTSLPLTREDTIFVYMSTGFFQGLLSPQYQIELRRRMQSVTDMELLQLARLAAKAEGIAAGVAPAETVESIEELISAGTLPRGFGRRPDGSGPIENGAVSFDSRRGARGTFLPVPDVSLEGVTAEESARYAQLAETYAREWQQMDPLLIGLKRYALPAPAGGEQIERIVIDGNIAPLNDQKYKWLTSMLGPPTREFITPAPGDVISAQAVIQGGGGGLLANVPPHHMFLGVQDMPPIGEFPPKGILKTFQMLKSTPGYLGAWPQPGILDQLPFGLAGRPDANGFSRLLFGLWRRQGGGFSVLSFDFPLLAETTQHLQIAQASNEAQIRVHIGDVSQAKLAQWIHGTYFQRAWQASASNTKLLHTLNQQLHVPLPECRRQAESLLDAKLRCTLGGEYQLVEEPQGGAIYWRSSAWSTQGMTSMPSDYASPLLAWFRGLDLHVTKYDDKVVARAEIDVARKGDIKAPPEENGQGNAPGAASGIGTLFSALPAFDMSLFSGQSALKPAEKPKTEKPLAPVPKESKPPAGREF